MDRELESDIPPAAGPALSNGAGPGGTKVAIGDANALGFSMRGADSDWPWLSSWPSL